MLMEVVEAFINDMNLIDDDNELRINQFLEIDFIRKNWDMVNNLYNDMIKGLSNYDSICSGYLANLKLFVVHRCMFNIFVNGCDNLLFVNETEKLWVVDHIEQIMFYYERLLNDNPKNMDPLYLLAIKKQAIDIVKDYSYQVDSYSL